RDCGQFVQRRDGDFIQVPKAMVTFVHQRSGARKVFLAKRSDEFTHASLLRGSVERAFEESFIASQLRNNSVGVRFNLGERDAAKISIIGFEKTIDRGKDGGAFANAILVLRASEAPRNSAMRDHK